jgi:hypothetical protein
MIKRIVIILAVATLSKIAVASSFYASGNCEYKVQFPSEPKYIVGYLPQSGKYEIAELKIGNGYDGYVLKVECVPVTPEQHSLMDSESYMLNRAEAYVTSNGFANAEYRFQETKIGKMVSVRAYKNISNIPVIYEVHMYLGNSSFLSLYAGGPSKSYPQNGIVEFFKSISLK